MRKPLDPLASPVFIGATGGSGTRVVARIAQHAGCYMGDNHNFALDAMDFVPWVTRWAPEYLAKRHPTLSGKTASRPDNAIRPEPGMNRDFDLAVALLRYRIPEPAMPWGAKGPRFVYVLPYLQWRFPSVKFIHVVRDGRDMAFAGNQSQVHDYGAILLGEDWSASPEPVRSAALWNRVNLDAHAYGSTAMGDTYLLVRFEDLCDDPGQWVQTIFSFLGRGDATREAVAEVEKQPTTGRWQRQDPALATEVMRVCEPGLQRFGYVGSSAGIHRS